MILAAALALLAPQSASPGAACLVCHRAATRSLEVSPHGVLERRPERPRLPGFAGEPRPVEPACVACHGAGTEHATAAKARRFEPRSFPIPAGACRACHAGPIEAHDRVPDFRAERACESCHRIHGPPAPRAGADRRAIARHGAGAPEGKRVGPFALRGFAEGGVRSVRVAGSGGAFEQDVNLASGARLLGARVEGRAVEDASVDAFVVAARGLGDPHAAVVAEARRDEQWTARVEWRRDEFVFRSESDFHRQRETRDEVAVALATDPAEPGDASFGVDASVGSRDADDRATFAFTNFFLLAANDLLRPPFNPADLDASRRDVGATARFDLGGFGFFVRPEWRESVDRVEATFRGPAQTATSVVVDERRLDQAWRSSGPAVTARVARALFGGGVDFDVGFRQAEPTVRIDLDERVVGSILGPPSTPFAADADSHGRSRGRLAEFDGEVRMRPFDALELRVRGVRREEDVSSRLETVLHLPGIAVVHLPFVTGLESVLQSGQAELRLRAAPPLDLRAGWERWRQELEYKALPTVGFVAGTVEAEGPTAGLTVRPARGWSLDLDARSFDAGDTMYETQPEEGRTLRASLRGKLSSSLAVRLLARRRSARVTDFETDAGDEIDSRRDLRSQTLSLDWTPEPGFAAGLSASRQHVRSGTDAYFFANGALESGESEVDGTARVLTGTVAADLAERVRSVATATHGKSFGDFDYRFQDLAGRVEVEVRPDLVVGVEARYVEFAPGGGAPERRDGYDARVAMVFTRVSF